MLNRLWIILALVLAGLAAALTLASPALGKNTQAPCDINIPILAYHQIDLTTPTKWYVAVDQFALQMDALKAYGYQTISMQDYMSYTNGLCEAPERPIIITIDDGFESVYQYAGPILKQRDQEATIFVITGKLGDDEASRQNNQSWEPTEPLAYHLIWPEALSLFNDGFKIESHTVNHKSLPTWSSAVRWFEISQARQDIQNALPGDTASFFAYPYGAGATDAAIRQQVQDAGYQAAVGYPPADAIANPSTSDLWDIPRRGIDNTITLELNGKNPFTFFMRRVDPTFPLPNISIAKFQVLDNSGSERTQLFSNEPVTVSVMVSNWNSPVNVIGELELLNSQGSIYNSHTNDPVTDAAISPLNFGNASGTFSYRWVTPVVTATESVSYSLRVRDASYLLGYYESGVRAAFTVKPSPISVHANLDQIDFRQVPEQEVTFTVNNTGPAAQKMYLDVSFSNGVVVSQAAPPGQWRYVPPGSLIKARGCSSPCITSQYPIYELSETVYGSGERTYQLKFRPALGVGGAQWIKYRVAMQMPDDLLDDLYLQMPNSPTSDAYLRDPLNGSPDQQHYFAYSMPVINPESVFLPLVFH